MINNKPIYLWPFILVYRIVALIIKFPILFVRYFCTGFFFSVWFLIKLLIMPLGMIFKYSYLGLLFICYIVYSAVKMIFKLLFNIVKYFIYGLAFPFIALYKSINRESSEEERNNLKEQRRIKEEKRKLEKARLKNEKAEQKLLREQKKEEDIKTLYLKKLPGVYLGHLNCKN